MSESNKKLCRTQRIAIFIGFVIFQIVISFFVSYILVTPNSYYIPTEVADKVLNSLIDVSIALFGFVGLILVFTLRNLLTTKGNLQNERFETSIKISQFNFQIIDTSLNVSSRSSSQFLEEAIRKCDEQIEDINGVLARNKKQINNALFFGVVAIGFAVTCTFMSILAFGANSNGLHFLHLALPFSLFFMCFDFIVVAIKTAID